MLAIIAGASFYLSSFGRFLAGRQDNQNNVLSSNVSNVPVYTPSSKLENPPEIVKAVYVTGWSAGNKKYLDYLNYLFKNTEINAVVVDIKDSGGGVSYNSGAEAVKKYNLYNRAIKDIDALIKSFHDQNVYVIGRIVVFEDTVYSKVRPDLAIYDELNTTDKTQPVLWRDNSGLSWLDPASKEVWDYTTSLAKDAFYNGFDEINFDYIRFPSDGKTKNMGFPFQDDKTSMSEVIKSFFQYLRANLSGKISVDLFGQTTTSTSDMGIGQIIEDAFGSFDYISPMIYPSHYIDGFLGFSNPAEHPYEVVNDAMSSAITKLPLAKFRPWIQDFDMGASYSADMVKLEIKATQDALVKDYNGFMLWNAGNIYTAEAVSKP